MPMVNTRTTRDIITDAQYADLRAKLDVNKAWVDGLRKRTKCRACKGCGKLRSGLRDPESMCTKCDGKGYTLGNACYKVEDMPADVPNMSNEERSKVEVYEFVRDKPQRYFAYVYHDGFTGKPTSVRTFTGSVLGHVTWYGPEYKVHAIGQPSTRQNLRVVGMNGVVYSAVYYKSSGDYCRMKAFKNADKNAEVSK